MAGMKAFYGPDGRGTLPESALDALEANAPDFAARLKALHGGEAAPDRWRALHRLARPVWTTEMVIPPGALAAIDIPVLVILGQNDEFFRPEDALALARTLPKGEIAILPVAGHAAFRQRPALFAGIVLDVLARAAAR